MKNQPNTYTVLFMSLILILGGCISNRRDPTQTDLLRNTHWIPLLIDQTHYFFDISIGPTNNLLAFYNGNIVEIPISRENTLNSLSIVTQFPTEMDLCMINGVPWSLSTDSGGKLMMYDFIAEKWVEKLLPKVKSDIRTCKVSGNYLILLFSRYIAIYDDKDNWKIIDANGIENFAKDIFANVVIDDSGHIWASLLSGKIYLYSEQALTWNFITEITEGVRLYYFREKILWVSSRESKTAMERLYSIDTSIPEYKLEMVKEFQNEMVNDIYSINGEVWVVGSNNIWIYSSSKIFQKLELPNGVNYIISSFYDLSKQRLYIGTNEGIYYLEIGPP
jgi:hypothetical protein